MPHGEPTFDARGGRDVRVDQLADGRRATMKIELPLSGETFEAELVADEHGTLCVPQRSAAIGVRTEHSRLDHIVKLGWRIVQASPAEQALLDAHGFGSGPVQ